MKKYLITGGAGFIGSHFIEMLLNHEEDALVFNLDKLTYAGKYENMPFLEDERHFLIHGDICDPLVVSNLFEKHNFDVVVNFAAESHVDNSINEPSIFMQTNILGVVNLLNSAKKYWKDYSEHLFVQISTDEVYGSLGENGLFDEVSLIKPNSPYSSSKAAADLIALSYFSTYEIPIMITRSSNNYGPRQDNEKLIPKIITNAILGKDIPIYGNGMNVRDWIYVKDNCYAILLLISLGKVGEIYNIGGSNEKTNLEITNTILSKLNLNNDLIKFVPDRQGHDFRYAINDFKTLTTIGKYVRTGFEKGLLETINYFVNISD
jgi:dTDP-glucose 4,6-dehydratase